MILSKKRIIFFFLYTCFLLLLVEVVSRAEWSIRREVPFFSPNTYFYYPELRDAERKSTNKEDNFFDILLLGGSVLHKKRSNIYQILLEKTTFATKRKIRVHNLSEPGHTSLDSYYKYRHLSNKKFDLVLFYHGINDLRLNNCPTPIYQNDYSHYSWYKVINLFERHRNTRHIASLYSLYYRLIRVRERLSSPPLYIPRKTPTEEWTKYGSNIKSADAFSLNLKKILEIAYQKQEPVLLMTFCSYVPKDYSLERFENRELDYCLNECPIEIWGTPKNIVTGLTVHNKIIKSFAENSAGVVFVDQEALMPKNGLYFNDICHLTHKGCERFVDNIMEIILELT